MTSYDVDSDDKKEAFAEMSLMRYQATSLGEIDEAKKYIQTIQGQQTTRIFCVNSHHPIIDAVLNHKYQTAREHGIDVQIKVNDLSGVALETDQLVVLLSNLLDNAIEGCCRVDGERNLYCSIIADDDLLLSVRNTSQPVKIWNNTIRSVYKELHADRETGC